MKTQSTGLCLSLCLSLTAITSAIMFTGCAGDRYNRSTGEYIDDKSINMRVRDALNDNPSYKFGSVQIASFKGTVQLSGFVDTYDQKYTANTIARKVQGVHDVENNITVKDNDKSGSDYIIDDKALASRVNDVLGNNADYKFEEVSAVALHGTVQLRGFVNTADQKNKAGDLAKGVSGVKDVVNNITVKDKIN